MKNEYESIFSEYIVFKEKYEKEIQNKNKEKNNLIIENTNLKNELTLLTKDVKCIYL